MCVIRTSKLQIGKLYLLENWQKLKDLKESYDLTFFTIRKVHTRYLEKIFTI